MFRMMLAAVTLLTQSMGFARAEESEKRWSVYTSDHYQLFHKPEHEKDAKKVKGFLYAGTASLKKEFDGFPVDDVLRVKCDIYLHPEATNKASSRDRPSTRGRTTRASTSQSSTC
jgi:hypothetical protein